MRFASIDPPTSRLHNKPTTMSTRNKLRSANSIDESASNSTTTSDTMEPTAKSDEFVSFVRSALNSINVKMDSVLSSQANFEKKLTDMDTRVTDLTKSINFNADNISDQNQSVTVLQKALTDVTRDLQSATVTIAKLEDKSNRAERHSRSFNVRLLGVREVDGENCVNRVEQILLDKFGLKGNIIENAHRTGKRSADGKYPRHIIARFHSRVTRGNVMRSTRDKLNNSPYRFVDDLTQTDLMAKQRVRPFMVELYKGNKKPSFRNGKLFSEGREVTSQEINRFLDK